MGLEISRVESPDACDPLGFLAVAITVSNC
jgi:hypothetical protein